jgi:hypothetical protein
MNLRPLFLAVPNNIFEQNFSDPYKNATQRITLLGDNIFTLALLKPAYYQSDFVSFKYPMRIKQITFIFAFYDAGASCFADS